MARSSGQVVLHTGQYPSALTLLQNDITDVDKKVRLDFLLFALRFFWKNGSTV